MKKEKLKNIKVYYGINLIFNNCSQKYKENLQKEIINDLRFKNIKFNFFINEMIEKYNFRLI